MQGFDLRVSHRLLHRLVLHHLELVQALALGLRRHGAVGVDLLALPADPSQRGGGAQHGAAGLHLGRVLFEHRFGLLHLAFLGQRRCGAVNLLDVLAHGVKVVLVDRRAGRCLAHECLDDGQIVQARRRLLRGVLQFAHHHVGRAQGVCPHCPQVATDQVLQLLGAQADRVGGRRQGVGHQARSLRSGRRVPLARHLALVGDVLDRRPAERVLVGPHVHGRPDGLRDRVERQLVAHVGEQPAHGLGSAVLAVEVARDALGDGGEGHAQLERLGDAEVGAADHEVPVGVLVPVG